MQTSKLFVFIAIMLVFGATARSQITITQGSFAPVGTSYTNYSTTDMVSITAGPAGANQVWTIPTLTTDPGLVTNLVAPGSTPYAGSYPTATHAITTTGGGSWNYLRVASDAISLLGIAGQYDTLEMVAIFNPAGLMAPLPMSYPHGSWTSVTGYTIEPFPGFPTTITDSTIYTLDAWGTLHTQFGTWQVLRVFMHTWLSTRFMSLPPVVTESIEFSWMNQHGLSVCAMSPDGTNPNFTTAYVSFGTEGAESADPVRGPVARSFEVGQNFPNPFNPTTTLPLELANAGRVDVSIYNEAGQLVSHEEMTLPAGQHNLPLNASSWSSGNYFAQVSAAGQARTTRMTLVK